MTKERALWGQFLLSSSDWAEREQKVLRYVIHRIDEDADFHEVLREPYVRRNCSRGDRRDSRQRRARPRRQGAYGADVALGGAGSQTASLDHGRKQ